MSRQKNEKALAKCGFSLYNLILSEECIFQVIL